MNAIGPITPHGTVVINGGFDRSLYSVKKNNTTTPWASRGSTDHNVYKHDLCFRYTGGQNKRKRATYNEPDIHVFSTCNGLKVESSTGNAEKRRNVRDCCKFIGVTHADMGADMPHNASLTVAGLTTIMNNGPAHICPGDTVVWDVPPFDEEQRGGSNKSRKVFNVKPYNMQRNDHTKVVHEIIKNGNPEDDDQNEDANMVAKMWHEFCETMKINDAGLAFNSVKSFLEHFGALRRELDSRVIGTAMTYSAPDSQMDILIRYGGK